MGDMTVAQAGSLGGRGTNRRKANIEKAIDAIVVHLLDWEISSDEEGRDEEIMKRHYFALGGLLALSRGFMVPNSDLLPIYDVCGCPGCKMQAKALRKES